MLKIYLSTVLIWMIIFYCLLKMFRSSIKENGWLDDIEPAKTGKLFSLFAISAIPFLRLLVFIGVIYITSVTKDKHEKMKDKHEEDD